MVKFGRHAPSKDRLERLAENIEALARKDEERIQEAHHIDELRREAAAELHSCCARFASSVNRLLNKVTLELSPPEYDVGAFRDPAVNVFQINAAGRVIHIKFQATDTLTSTEQFRIPYILQGAIRWFNQEMLDHTIVTETMLFYCVEKDRGRWVVFDPRTHRVVPFDQDYLVALMERLV